MPESKPRFTWGEFLKARINMIHYHLEVDGWTPDQVAQSLSMDATQVALIADATEPVREDDA